MFQSIYCLHETPFKGEDEKYHYLYRITNRKNKKIYIGIHSTSDLNDGYMGSGKAIGQAMDIYGIEYFTKEILFFFNTRKELYDKEAEIVNEEFLARPDVYNLQKGGLKPLYNTKLSKDTRQKISNKTRGENNPRYSVKLSDDQKNKISNSLKIRYQQEPEILIRISNSLKEYYKNNPEAGEQIRERNIKNRELLSKANIKGVLLVSCEPESYGEIIIVFSSHKEAAYKLNILESAVSNIVRKLNGKEYFRRLYNNNKPSVGVGWTLIDPDRYDELFGDKC